MRNLFLLLLSVCLPLALQGVGCVDPNPNPFDDDDDDASDDDDVSDIPIATVYIEPPVEDAIMKFGLEPVEHLAHLILVTDDQFDVYEDGEYRITAQADDRMYRDLHATVTTTSEGDDTITTVTYEGDDDEVAMWNDLGDGGLAPDDEYTSTEGWESDISTHLRDGIIVIEFEISGAESPILDNLFDGTNDDGTCRLYGSMTNDLSLIYYTFECATTVTGQLTLN